MSNGLDIFHYLDIPILHKKINSVIVEYHYKYPYVNNSIINKNFTFFFILLVEVPLVLEFQGFSSCVYHFGALVAMPDSSNTPASLEDAILKLAAQQLSMGETLQTVTFQLNEILHRLPPTSPNTGPATTTSVSSSSPAHHHRIKIDVPRFDGSDPSGWIFKITQYFEYHSTPEAERLTITAFYMDGCALAWFQWMNNNGQFTSWPAFLQAVQTRFAPSQYEDPTSVLFKLTQRGTVAQYLAEFEELANRIVGLPPPFLLSCFVSGLSPDIRREVQAHQPLTLVQAAGLARL